jgi:SET domain-containing protein
MTKSTGVAVRPSPIHGLGVFATSSHRNGDVILAIDDSRQVSADNPLRTEKGEMDYHCDYLKEGRVILMGYPERHINHCCVPNAYVKTVESVRLAIALTDIARMQEITFDYCINSGGDTIWRCTCGHRHCRHSIHSSFFHLPEELQLTYLPFLDDWFVAEHFEQIELLARLKNTSAL